MNSEKKNLTHTKMSPAQRPFDFSYIPSTADSHTQTHTRACIDHVRDSEGTSWFRVRPGRRALKAMGTAGHRREDVPSSAEMRRAEG